MAIRWLTLVGCCLVVCLVLNVGGQDDLPDKPEPRLAALAARASQLKIKFVDDSDRTAPQLMPSPVLRTNDPTRNEVDGAVWLWLDGKRPVAALGVMYYASGKWNYELSSMSGEQVEVTGRPTWAWRPPAVEPAWFVMEDAVPDAPRARQLLMR